MTYLENMAYRLLRGTTLEVKIKIHFQSHETQFFREYKLSSFWPYFTWVLKSCSVVYAEGHHENWFSHWFLSWILTSRGVPIAAYPALGLETTQLQLSCSQSKQERKTFLLQ